MKTVVLDAKATNPGDNPWTPVEAFGQVTTYDQTSAADTLARAEGADILITNKVVLDAETLAQLPDLSRLDSETRGERSDQERRQLGQDSKAVLIGPGFA